MRYIGTVLALVGVSLIGIARFQLGKSFAIKAEAHELVTRGLYSKIRNPIYVFGRRDAGWLNIGRAEACSVDRARDHGYRSGDPRPS
jgi:hypothetical protein